MTPPRFAAGPRTVPTARGPVECAVDGDGPAVLALHGAMGGWDQAALLDALGVRRAAVLAVSGGPAALQFALRHPDRCWALVLVSTTGGRVTTRLPLRFHLLRGLRRSPSLLARMGLGRRAAARDPEVAARRAIPDPELRRRTLADPEAGPLVRRVLASTASRLPERLRGTLHDVALTRAHTAYPLEAVRVPTVVVHGGSDRVTPLAEHGRVLASRIPGARLVTAPDGDHLFVFTHRGLVRAEVERFLRAHAPGGEAAYT